MNKYAIISAFLFVSLIVLTALVAARNSPISSSQAVVVTSDDGAEPRACNDGEMKCEEITRGCRHKTCSNGAWGDWVNFGKKYACGSNDGGGRRCVFQGETCEGINDPDCIPMTNAQTQPYDDDGS